MPMGYTQACVEYVKEKQKKGELCPKIDPVELCKRSFKQKQTFDAGGIPEGVNPPVCPPRMKRTDNYCSEEIAPKGEFDPRSFRVLKVGAHRITIGCPKGQWDPEINRCKVGTRAHSLWHPIEEFAR